jgi:hypothetical protein
MKKYLRLGTLAILSASTPFIAHADTLTLEATSGVLNPSGYRIYLSILFQRQRILYIN